MKKLFVDVSAMRQYFQRNAVPSGIQRVIVLFVQGAVLDRGVGNVFLSYVGKGGGYRAVPVPCADALGTEKLRELLNIPAATIATLPTLEKYRTHRAKRLLHYLLREYNAARGNDAHFRRRGTTIEGWRAAKHNAVLSRRRESKATPPHRAFSDIAAPGDDLILMDASWVVGGLPGACRAAAADGVNVIPFVHDLIPLNLPYVVSRDQRYKFHAWLGAVPEYAQRFLANSEFTARDLRQYLSEIPGGGSADVVAVPLAQERFPVLEGEAATGADGSDDVPTPFRASQEIASVDAAVAALLKGPFVLCVGTIEIRKNPWRIAQAWKQLVERGIPDLPKLVFAGRKGWLVEDFRNLMSATGQLGGYVEIIDGPSDTDLDFLYRHCEFTVLASLYEGWGLPIGEGLSYGKTGVVADMSSMPEVGGDMVEYCDPRSISSIADACARLVTDTERRRTLEARIAETRLRSWPDVVRDILAAI
jgi:glycosyltransferase involved in cell wall biosynthesis